VLIQLELVEHALQPWIGRDGHAQIVP
jgi:hypothetical protein